MPRDPGRFTAVSVRDTIPPVDVPDHHVYLAFNIDRDAADFKQWWAEQGGEVFAVWLRAKAAGGAAAKTPTPPSLLADCVVEIGPPVDVPPACLRCGAKTTHAKLFAGRCPNCQPVR